MNSCHVYSEMEYGKARERKLLAEGELDGIKYYITSLGTHPCAYVVVTKEEEESEEFADMIDCHGGITYGGRLNDILDVNDDDVYILGWDYAHGGDFLGSNIDFIGLDEEDEYHKKHTVHEMIYDCIHVVSQVNARRAAKKAYDETYQRALTNAGLPRIEEYCKRLAAVWNKVPHWRLGQLMSNMERAYSSMVKRDIFFPEDEELMSFMEKYFEVEPSEQT